jgi:hypothetical protein
MKKLRISLLLAALVLGATGCQVLTYTAPSGERFRRAVIGTRTSLAGLTVETGTNGIRRIELRGYQNDATQALGIVTEAAVRAALNGAAPAAGQVR